MSERFARLSRGHLALASSLLALCLLTLAGVTLPNATSTALAPTGLASSPVGLGTAPAALAAPQALGGAADGAQPSPPKTTKRQTQSAYAKLPLSFVPNAGQTDKRVRYSAESSGFGFYFTQEKAVLAFSKGEGKQVLDLRFLGADPNAKLVASDRGEGTVNYLRGSDRSQWQTGLPSYGKLTYRALWPGIDMVFVGRGGRLTYEFVLHPGARPSDIRLAYEGAEGLSLTTAGGLLIKTRLGVLSDKRPRTFQPVAGRRTAVDSRFVVRDARKGSFGFAVGPYDPTKPLVIDPALAYSTYLGGSGDDDGSGIAVDSAGNAYVIGSTTAGDFPTSAGAFRTALGGQGDAFVTKFDPAGTGLVYSTYLGGNRGEYGSGIAVDSAGNAYVTGFTTSGNFPTSAGAFQSAFGGLTDAFVTKLDASGAAIVYSTYLGGNSGAYGTGIAVDSGGNAYVTGYTSGNFPTTPGAFQAAFGGGCCDAFVTKLNPSGAGLAYSTDLGGSGDDRGTGIAVDSAGNAYVTGSTTSGNFPTSAGAFQSAFGGLTDAFVTKLDASGAAIAYSTYLGGSDADGGRGIAVDSAGYAYVTGYTSGNFPTTAGAFQTALGGVNSDAFVTKLNPSGSAFAYSTYLGGSDGDAGLGVVVDSAGSAYVTGYATSGDFPASAGVFQTAHGGGFNDAFVTKLNPSGSALAYSTYLGGSGDEQGLGVAIDSAGSAYVTGYTSGDFPTGAGAFQTAFGGGCCDAFVTKLDAGAGLPPLPSISITDLTKAEGNAGTRLFTLTLSLSSPTSQDVTVDFTTADGTATTSDSDYLTRAGSKIFSAGQLSKTVNVIVMGDSKFEPDENFFVNLSNPVNATIADNEGIGTIQNDDPQPQISISDASKPEGNSGSSLFTLTLSLSNPSDQPITVDFTTADGTATTSDSDYLTRAGSKTFLPGELVKTVNPKVIGDTAVEPDEDFFVNLSNPVDATIADSQGKATIQNDD